MKSLFLLEILHLEGDEISSLEGFERSNEEKQLLPAAAVKKTTMNNHALLCISILLFRKPVIILASGKVSNPVVKTQYLLYYIYYS